MYALSLGSFSFLIINHVAAIKTLVSEPDVAAGIGEWMRYARFDSDHGSRNRRGHGQRHGLGGCCKYGCCRAFLMWFLMGYALFVFYLAACQNSTSQHGQTLERDFLHIRCLIICKNRATRNQPNVVFDWNECDIVLQQGRTQSAPERDRSRPSQYSQADRHQLPPWQDCSRKPRLAPRLCG